MIHDEQERATALAGIYQALACVLRIARTGTADGTAMEPCIYSLFQVDAENVPAVFGPPGVLANGARQIVAQLTGKPERDLELTRYAVSVLKLERVLSRRPEMLDRIRQGIAQANLARGRLALLDPEMLARLARIYSDTLSHLEPRIRVRGEPLHLKVQENQDRIRALLLAAIRCAMLWRQIGGTRWQMLLGHKRVLQEARRYLDGAAAARPQDSTRWPSG